MTLKTTEVIVNIENDLTINAEIGAPDRDQTSDL